MVLRWLDAPHVQEFWYDEPNTLEGLEESYLPKTGDPSRPHSYVIEHAAIPIGLIQWYPLGDDAGNAALVGGLPGEAGVDLFIADEAYRHRGLGAPLLRRFLRQVVFADPQITGCVIGPESNNAAAIRAYEKAGFRYYKTVQVPGERFPEHLMRLRREDLPAVG
jgi:aminoglycoside 6'-N-acetyltransferase